MPKTKFGVGQEVKTESGFEPYEGPKPKTGVVYPVELKQCRMVLTGPKSKNPGTQYVKTLWEITSGECKGFGTWYNIVPGEHEIQQIRVAQFMQAVCGKNEADIVHDKIEDGGNITKVGGKKAVGTQARMTFVRKRDTYGVPEGEEAPWVAETADIIPGASKKSSKATDDEPEDDEDEAEDEEAVEAISLAEAKKMTVKELKAFAEDEGIDEATLPKAKSKIIESLVGHGLVEDETADEDEDEEEEDETSTEEETEEDEDSTEDDEEEDEEDDEDSTDDEEDDDPLPLTEAKKMSLVDLKAVAKKWESELDLDSYKGPKGKKKLIFDLMDEEIVEDEASDEPPF